jgi:hypothetical protein
MVQGWDEEVEKMLAQVREQLGPHARAVLSVFGRLNQEKPPEVVERVEQKVVDQARSSRRGRGRKKKPRDQHRDLIVGRYAQEHGIEAAMRKYPQIGSRHTMSEYRRRARRHDEKSK